MVGLLSIDIFTSWANRFLLIIFWWFGWLWIGGWCSLVQLFWYIDSNRHGEIHSKISTCEVDAVNLESNDCEVDAESNDCELSSTQAKKRGPKRFFYQRNMNLERNLGKIYVKSYVKSIIETGKINLFINGKTNYKTLTKSDFSEITILNKKCNYCEQILKNHVLVVNL